MIFVYFPVFGIFSQVLSQVSRRRREEIIDTVHSLRVVICAYLRTKLAYIHPLLFSFMRFEKRRRIYFTSYPRESSGEFKGTAIQTLSKFPPASPISATTTDAGGVYKRKGVHRSAARVLSSL